MLIGLVGLGLGGALGWLAWKSPLPRPVADVVLSTVLLVGIAVTAYADGDVARGGAGIAAGVALASLVTMTIRLTGGDARLAPRPDPR